MHRAFNNPKRWFPARAVPANYETTPRLNYYITILALSPVVIGLGRIVALPYRSPTLYQIH